MIFLITAVMFWMFEVGFVIAEIVEWGGLLKRGEVIVIGR